MYENVLELIEAKRYSEAKAALSKENATDIAEWLSDVTERELTVIYRLLPKDLAAEVFSEMYPQLQEHLIEAFSDRELSEILSQLFVDDTVDMLEEMPASIVRRVLKHMSKEKRAAINEVLSYPAESAGSIMTVEFVNLNKDMSVREAFDKIRCEGIDKETVYTCYVTDAKRILIGVISAKTLLLACPDDKINDIMETAIISCRTDESCEDVAHRIEKYGFLALPVVDFENRLVGIVTFDDAMDVIKNETDDDIMKMAGLTPSDQTYLKTSVLSHSKNRLLWLLVLMFSATFTGIIITSYENALSAILVSFIPMLMGTGGNSGSQSSAIIIRGLATEEIKPSDFWKVILKELRIGLLVGAVLAVANAIRIYLLDIFVYHTPGGLTKEMFIVGATLALTVVTAKLLGAALPILAKRINLDPALFASPIMTTIVDTFTVFIYFIIATSAM